MLYIQVLKISFTIHNSVPYSFTLQYLTFLPYSTLVLPYSTLQFYLTVPYGFTLQFYLIVLPYKKKQLFQYLAP